MKPWSLMLVPALCFGAPQQKPPSSGKVHLSLTYSERNGGAFPCGMGMSLVVAPVVGAVGLAQAMQGLDSMGRMLNDLFSGKEAKVPKTSGETARLMATPYDNLVATLPMSSNYQARLEADLAWNEGKRAYIVQSGTLTWTGNNNGRFQAKESLLYDNLSGGGQHQLKGDEVRIEVPDRSLAQALDPRRKKDAAATYTLHLDINPKQEPITGEGGMLNQGEGHVLYEVKERYTTGGRTTDVNVIDGFMKDSAKEGPWLFSKALKYSAEDREVVDHVGSFSETWNTAGTMTAISWELRMEGVLDARPKAPGSVERGTRVKLDGSDSRGDIKEYTWTFAANGGTAPNPGSKKKGKEVEVLLLDSTKVTLTVTDGRDTVSRSIPIQVTAREAFKTRFTHVAAEGELGDGSCPRCVHNGFDPKTGAKTYTGGWEGGENVCAVDPPTAGVPEKPHIIHPKVDTLGADTHFVVERAQDAEGPWDGFSWFKEWKAEVRRQSRVNLYLREQGPPCDGVRENFYQGNLARGTKVVDYLAAVRRHERSHSDLMEQALKEMDPAKDFEARVGSDGAGMRSEATRRVKEAETALHSRAKDPLEKIWEGELSVPERNSSEWRSFVMQVGGPGYGGQ